MTQIWCGGGSRSCRGFEVDWESFMKGVGACGVVHFLIKGALKRDGTEGGTTKSSNVRMLASQLLLHCWDESGRDQKRLDWSDGTFAILSLLFTRARVCQMALSASIVSGPQAFAASRIFL